MAVRIMGETVSTIDWTEEAQTEFEEYLTEDLDECYKVFKEMFEE